MASMFDCSEQIERMGITVTGIVQGVGFRPFVHRLAHELKLSGWVLNAMSEVEIELEGSRAKLDEFMHRLRAEAPSQALITAVMVKAVLPKGEKDFVIRTSEANTARTVLIAPDIAICADCAREIAADNDRRYAYSFTNCTNCGPRYTIIKDVPYDRINTTMADFAMCEHCQSEYDDFGDRRFHAQPNACADCGPAYTLSDNAGRILAGEPLNTARRLIGDGAIIAVKGIGGYHLACSAYNSAAVSELRRRKGRDAKPFAVMAGSLAKAKEIAAITSLEEDMLTSSVAPIMLLNKNGGYNLATEVTHGNPTVGIMLPYAPVHRLLLSADDVWVMTSGNRGDEPIGYEDETAKREMAHIADYFLAHNRRIFRRADDSVIRTVNDKPMIIRRSRGLVPLPLAIPQAQKELLAVGGELKNTFCLTGSGQAFIGPHIGDLKNMSTYQSFTQAIEDWQRFFALKPQMVVHDLHPEYLSTKFALGLPLPRLAVQHHHAHIAAVMAEYGLEEKVIGLAFDGTGYGADGNLWGGEFLVADLCGYERYGHFSYIPLQGGDKAIKEPWRVALWLIDAVNTAMGEGYIPQDFLKLPQGWELSLEAARKGLNSPLTSSVGRLFDAVSALLGICGISTYEGRAAIELEWAVGNKEGIVLPHDIKIDSNIIVDLLPTFACILRERQRGASAAHLAASFHMTIAAATVSTTLQISKGTGIKKVALGGGVFQNKILLTKIIGMLEKEGMEIFLPKRVPINDGGLALGQAAIGIHNYRVES